MPKASAVIKALQVAIKEYGDLRVIDEDWQGLSDETRIVEEEGERCIQLW